MSSFIISSLPNLQSKLKLRCYRKIHTCHRSGCPPSTEPVPKPSTEPALKPSTEPALKPFHTIPGPKPLPLVGNLWRYSTGEYSFERLHVTGLKKYRQFGSIVREEIVPGVNLLLLYTPEDIKKMYEVEGIYPSRRSHTALEFYRLRKPHIYNSGGLLPTNGEKWHRLRVHLQRPINMLENIRRYIPDINEVADEFVEGIGGSSNDFLPDLCRVFLEFLGLVTFDVRLGSLSKTDERSRKLIEATANTNSRILKTDNGLQLWRKFMTPAYKKICESQEFIEKVALQYVNAKKSQMAEDQNKSENGKKTLLEVYLSTPELDDKDVVTAVADLLLAGIDTSSYTMSFILYHLAKNIPKQQELYNELRKILPENNSPVTSEVLAELKYLKAVVKETFRLNPLSIGVGRILPEDSSFSGYHCPKDTVLVSQNQVSCRLECYFKEPEMFLPERWMKGHPAQEKPHSHLVLPFGHGPRACIARRLAEQNIFILLAKIVRRFHIAWEGDELGCKSQLINRPDGPLKFHFYERD